MIKALIFDCFGVLTTDGWLPFKEKYFGRDVELQDQAGELNKQANAGLISFADLIWQVSEMAGIPVVEAHRAISSNVPNAKLFDYIESKKPDYKIGILSNAADNWLSELFTSQQLSLIDEVGLSYEMGVLKPHARAYETIAEKLGVHPEECLFVDDQERQCQGARDIGMAAVLYKDHDKGISDIERLLADSKN